MDRAEIEVGSAPALRDWLAQNHGQAEGVWVVTLRKSAGGTLTARDITAECLAYGWIDSLPRAKDANRTMLYIAPRKLGSNWSRVNKDLVARLEADGRLTDAGRAAVNRAKADGSWTALDLVEALDVPPDLAAAFATAQGARAVWDGFPRSVRRGALEILLNAKQAETRAAKIAAILDAIAAGQRPFQWTRK